MNVIKSQSLIIIISIIILQYVASLSQVLESYANKVMPGKGPLAEYQYWQKCEIGLIMLIEQLKMPIIKRILALLEQILSPIALNFQTFQTELWKHYVEARDNTKFLQTLLRYFKVFMEILIIYFCHKKIWHQSAKITFCKSIFWLI